MFCRQADLSGLVTVVGVAAVEVVAGERGSWRLRLAKLEPEQSKLDQPYV
jgi:hypothetical protein